MKARTLGYAVVPLTLAAGLAAGCGYSEDEWQAQLAKYAALDDKNKKAEAELARTKKELDEEKERVSQLTRKLEEMGVDMSKFKLAKEQEVSQLSSSLEEQRKALEEYKARARQLEAIKQRFELLRSKLNALTKLGLDVNIRRNRMVISLPGDVLFDSGKESLKKEGKDILGKVANVIRSDPTLAGRDYQVAGHTDDRPLQGGVFRDNWGLSLMRAREVLLFLVSPTEGKEPGGGLSPQKWSAAGFAETDPVAKNDTPDGRQKNRRCELIIMPNVEEMLDLKTLTQ